MLRSRYQVFALNPAEIMGLTVISIVIVELDGGMDVMETNVSSPAYDLLWGFEVEVKERELAIPGKGSPASPPLVLF